MSRPARDHGYKAIKKEGEEARALPKLSLSTKLQYKAEGNEQVFSILRKLWEVDLAVDLDYPTEVVDLLRNDRFTEVPQIDQDEYDPESDPHGFEKERIRNAISLREKRVSYIETKKRALFAYLESKVTEEFFDMLGRDNKAEFDRIRSNKDSASLWTKIVRLATVGGETDRAHARNQALNKLHTTRQTSVMSLDDYHRLFKIRLEVAQALGARVGKNPELADRFITQLDGSRYGQMQVDYRNNVRQGIREPVTTIEEAFTLAANTVVLRGGGKTGGGFAFYAAGSVPKTSHESHPTGGRPPSGPRDRRAPGRQGPRTGGGPAQPARRPAKTPESESKCNACGRMGHWARNCPDNNRDGHAAAIQQAIRAERSAAGGGPGPRPRTIRNASGNFLMREIPPDMQDPDPDFGL
jgi:hypothetical protein